MVPVGGAALVAGAWVCAGAGACAGVGAGAWAGVATGAWAGDGAAGACAAVATLGAASLPQCAKTDAAAAGSAPTGPRGAAVGPACAPGAGAGARAGAAAGRCSVRVPMGPRASLGRCCCTGMSISRVFAHQMGSSHSATPHGGAVVHARLLFALSVRSRQSCRPITAARAGDPEPAPRCRSPDSARRGPAPQPVESAFRHSARDRSDDVVLRPAQVRAAS